LAKNRENNYHNIIIHKNNPLTSDAATDGVGVDAGENGAAVGGRVALVRRDDDGSGGWGTGCTLRVKTVDI
jgi:hypothetical protein